MSVQLPAWTIPAPSGQPLDINEVKKHCRVSQDYNGDNPMLNNFALTAIGIVEAVSSVICRQTTATVEFARAYYVCRKMASTYFRVWPLRRYPLDPVTPGNLTTAVTSLKIQKNDETELDVTGYKILGVRRSEIWIPEDAFEDIDCERPDACNATIKVGSVRCPADAQTAASLLIAWWYMKREIKEDIKDNTFKGKFAFDAAITRLRRRTY